MLELFQQWIQSRENDFQKLGINTTFILSKGAGDDHLAKPFIQLVQETDHCMGQVIVYASGEVEQEVVDIDSGKQLLWKYTEKVQDVAIIGNILEQYLEIMISAKKV